jgi:hypothetical protein
MLVPAVNRQFECASYDLNGRQAFVPASYLRCMRPSLGRQAEETILYIVEGACPFSNAVTSGESNERLRRDRGDGVDRRPLSGASSRSLPPDNVDRLRSRDTRLRPIIPGCGYWLGTSGVAADQASAK